MIISSAFDKCLGPTQPGISLESRFCELFWPLPRKRHVTV